VIPGMDEQGAQLAAAAILGPRVVPAEAPVTTSVTIGADSPLR
jgi:hypothetical protein